MLIFSISSEQKIIQLIYTNFLIINRIIDHQKLIKIVKEYRKKVGSKIEGIKLYNKLKADFIKADIKISRDKFYKYLRMNNLLIPKQKNHISTTKSKHKYKKYKNIIKIL